MPSSRSSRPCSPATTSCTTRVNFVYTADGGNAGVKDVQSGTSQFAVNTRAPLPSDAGTLQAKLYLDGLCVAVNKANKLTNLSLSRTANIFEGVFTNWGQVGGSGLSTTIDPIGRDSAAGSYTFFQQAVLNGQTQASNVEQLSSDGLVATAIKHDRNAIGYVGLAHSGKGSGVKALKLNGMACRPDQHQVREVPAQPVHLGRAPAPQRQQAGLQFFDWVRTSAKAGHDHRQERRGSRVQQEGQVGIRGH